MPHRLIMLTGFSAPCRSAARRKGTGHGCVRGLRSPLTRLRSTHVYVLVAANAAFSVPCRSAAQCKRIVETAYPVGLARAKGARSTHGYVLVAAAHINRRGITLTIFNMLAPSCEMHFFIKKHGIIYDFTSFFKSNLFNLIFCNSRISFSYSQKTQGEP